MKQLSIICCVFSYMKRLIYFFLLILLSVWSSAQTSKSALFLGNSYTYANYLPLMIQNIAASQGNEFSYSSNTPGGFSFAAHSTRPASLNKIDSADYDYLILQEQSVQLADTENGYSKYFHRSFPAAEFLDHRSKLSDVCHKTLFYLTWGRKEGNGIFGAPSYYGSNYGEMQDNLTENYLQLAQLLDAEVAPVGEVWRQMIANYPDIELYSADGSHPSVTGTYLAACVFYAAIFHEGMEQAWTPNWLSEATAKKIQDIVNEVLIESWSKWNIDISNSPCNSSASFNNNQHWSTKELSAFSSLSHIQFTSNQHGYVHGDNSIVWQTLDGGDSWLEIELPAQNTAASRDENSYDIFFLNKDTVWYAVGGDEIDSNTLVFTGINGFKGEFTAYTRLFRSVDAGKSWEERSPNRIDHEIRDSALLNSRPTFTNMHIHFDDGMKGTVYCNYGEDGDSLVHSFWTEDGGLSWNPYVAEIGKSSPQLWFQNTFEAYKSGAKDTSSQVESPQILYKTEDRGASWQEVVAFPNNCCKVPFYNIYQHISTFKKIGSDTLIALNSLYAPIFYRSIDGGRTWDSISTIKIAGKVHDFIQLPNGVYLLATGDRFGRVLASYDYGKTWVEEAYFEYRIQALTATDEYLYAAGPRKSIHRKKISLFESPSPKPVESSTFNLFPNPTEGFVNIEEAPANAEIKVYNTVGSLIQNATADSFGNAQLQLNQLPSGQYLVKVSFPKGVVTKKLILGSIN